MKKITLFQWWAIACLFSVCLGTATSCRKDLLQPNSNVLSSSITLAEAKQYFDANLKMANGPKKLMSATAPGKSFTMEEMIKNKQPLWDYAYEQLLSNGQALKIPIDFGDAYAEVSVKSKALLPLASLSYLYMYKDSLQNIHAEWVLLKPDSAWLYGKRDSYSGSILIKNWNGKNRRVYTYVNGLVAPKINLLKHQRLSSLGKIQNNGDTGLPPTDPIDPAPYYCIRVSTGTCPQLSPCSSDFCDMCLAYCAKQFCAWPTGGSNDDEPDLSQYDPNSPDDDYDDPIPGSTGGGGGPPPTTYPPTCESDPTWTIPTFPAPPGYDWVLPCSGAGGVPLPSDANPSSGQNMPFVSDAATVYSEDLGREISYGEVRQEFENNPFHLEVAERELEFGEHDDPWFPGKTSLDVMNEYTALKALYPFEYHSVLFARAYWNVMNKQCHFMLDLVGLAPVVGEAADILNGAIYYVEGDRLNAALSVGSAVPFVGWVSTGGKWVKLGVKTFTKPISGAAGKIAYRAVKTAKGGVRFIKVAIGTFSHSAITALRAIKPADNTLTNLSRQLIDQMAHRLLPTAQSLKNKIDDIILHPDLSGTKTEAICDELFETGGFVKHDAKFGSNNGFDGVYIKKDAAGNVEEILINEAKQVGVMGNIKLNGANLGTGLNPQMSDAWITDVLGKMKLEGGNLTALADLLNANRNSITKTVTGVDRSSGEIIIIKLKNY